MTAGKSALAVDRSTFAIGAALLGVAALAWVAVIRESATMSATMPGPSPSSGAAVAFVVAWGIMMTAMMLPSAAPGILLYRTVARRLVPEGERAIPPWMFAAIYLLVWMATGIPVYAGYVAVAALEARSPGFAAIAPYLVSAALVAAGIYQLTPAKRACLRYCESPLDLFMRKWRSGYAATARLALSAAGYCVGCCWGLMLILVVAGAMSLTWVLVITAIVFAEKVMPQGWRTARVLGVALILLGAAIAMRPEIASHLGGHGAMAGMR